MQIKGMHTLRGALAALVAALAPLLAHAGPVDDLLAADTAFAARAGESGQHIAFAEYSRLTGSCSGPRRLSASSGSPPTSLHRRLEWWPSAAAVDCSGRLGVTTGPWRYSNAAGGESATGHYLSVWRRDDDGQWRVVLDHGIDHASGVVPAEPLQAVLARWWPATGSGTCAGRDGTDRLARAEQQLDERMQRKGLQEALRVSAAKGALAYRDDSAPGPLAAAIGDAPFGPGTAVRAGNAITLAASDMAVTYGVLRSAGGTDRALYIRVWQRERRDWRVRSTCERPCRRPRIPEALVGFPSPVSLSPRYRPRGAAERPTRTAPAIRAMARKGIFFPLKDAALRDDVHALGELVGEVLKDQCGQDLFDAVEGDRLAAIGRRQGEPEAAVELVVRTQDRAPHEAQELIRAFSTWFQMVNLAEKVHRVRRRRQYMNDSSTPPPAGCRSVSPDWRPAA